MDKKSKIILYLVIGFVMLLFAIVFYTSYQIGSIKASYDQLAKSIQNIEVIDGIDGKDGKPGIDGSNGYDGVNGKNGKDSLSTSIKEIYYVPQPAQDGMQGEQGIAGRDGVSQDIRLDPETKDVQIKKSTDRYWFTLIPCAELIRSCPNTSVGTGNE